MQVDTQNSGLNLSTDVNHARYVTQYVTSASTLVGKEINTIEVWLGKSGNPTGNAIVGIWDSNRNLIKQFGVIDVATMPNVIKKYTFKIDEPYRIKTNDYIGIYYNGGDVSNYIQVRIDTTNPFDGANSYRCRYSTSWTCSTDDDIAMTLAYTPVEREFNIDKAYSYIISLYDHSIGLIKENESITKYWLWTDNLLAKEVLKDKDIALSAKIDNKIKEYTSTYQLQFRHPIGSLFNQVAYFGAVTNRNVIGNVWYSDADGVDLECTDYADIAFYKAIYYYNAKQYNKAKACYEQGYSMFDGYGFKDKAFYEDGNRYTTYKLALFKIASDITGYGTSTHINRAMRIIALMQDNTGGVYTHYREDLSPDSMTNVETTALAILAYTSQPRSVNNTDTSNHNLYYTIIGAVLAAGITVILLRRR